MSSKWREDTTRQNAQEISGYEEISNVHPSSSNSTGLGLSSSVQQQATSSPRSSKKRSFLGSLSKGTARKGTIITRPKNPDTFSEEPEEIKEGDAERIRIMNLVKEGKLSVEEAIEHAKNLGITTAVESTNDFGDSEEKIFNFGVYKYGRNGASLTRRIIQFDFQEKVLCIIQKGNRNKKFAFSEIRGFDSEDGLRFFIYFDSDYELDADSVEEKNKICHLLESIVQQNRGDEPDGEFETPSQDVVKIIKEGQIEKKGHSAAFMMWPRRWLRIQQGELSYYKMGEENQPALNIVKLGPGLAEVKSVDNNAFIIITSKKEYSFRVLNLNNVAESVVEKERDAWMEAISEASQLGFRKSRAISLPDEKAISSSVAEQEKYLKDVVKTLQRELEQLASVLSVVNAPIQATVQVKKVKDVVRTLDSQVKTGVLSWTMRQVLQARKSSIRDDSSGSPQGFNTSPPRRKDSDKLPTPPPPPRQEDGSYESVVYPQKSTRKAPLNSMGSTTSEYVSPPPRPQTQKLSNATNTPAPVTNNSSQIATSPFRPPRRKSPGSVKPYETVEIVPRKPSDPESVTSEPAGNSGEPWTSHRPPKRPPKPGSGSFTGEDPDEIENESIYQQPSGTPVSIITPMNDVYDNVRLKNTPTEPHSSSTTNTNLDLSAVKVSEDLVVNENNVPSDQEIQDDMMHASGGQIETTDGQLEIDSGGMGCSSIDKAMEERRQILLETESREGVVLISVQKRKENDDKQSETHAAEEVEEIRVLQEETRPASGSNPPPPPPPLPGAVPPPPPLVGSGMDGFPRKPCAVNPQVKLRPFFWNKVSQQMVSNSVWMSAADRSTNIDMTLLEEMFQIEEKEKTLNPAPTKTTAKTLLDPKRAQNLGIFLSGFKLSSKEIDEKLGVFREEDGALPMDHVIALKRFLPSTEESEMYRNYKEDPSTLVPEDQFMMKLCEISDLDKRLDLLLVIMEFPVQFQDLAPSVNSLFDACHELHSSKNFLYVLEYVLSIGNILNSGSNRGGAFGFRLTSLPKLADIRGKNRKYTLLKFLIAQLQQTNPESLNFTEELKSVPKAAACSFKGLLAEVEVMKKDLGKIKKHSKDLFLRQGRTNGQDVKLNNDVQVFVNEYEDKLNDMCDKCKEMQQIYKKVLVRFGEPSSSDSEELFGAISGFMTQFKKTLKELQGTKHNKGIKLEGLREAIAQRQKSTEDTISIASMSSVSSSSTVADRDFIDANKRETQDKQSEQQTREEVVVETKPAESAPSAPPRVIHTKLSTKTPPKPPVRADPKPTKQGYLDKLSGGKHQSRKWDSRYFELTDTGYLHYYKKPDGGKPINSIYLRGCPIEEDESDPCVILVKTDEREWSLKAVNSEEASAWRQALSFYTGKQN